MHSSANTCSRCRFFSRNNCSTRHCYDWRLDRHPPHREADREDERPRDDRDPARREG